MPDYTETALLQGICDNLTGTIAEGDDYAELRLLRGIVTAEGGTPTPVAGTYERITLLDDWITAIEADPPETDDYAEVERLRVIAAAYSAEVDEESTDYEVIRLLTAIEAATAA